MEQNEKKQSNRMNMDDLNALRLKNINRETHEKQIIQLEKMIERKPTGLGIASLIFGILSLVLFCTWFFALPCAVLAIIYGIWQLKLHKTTLAWIGIVLGIIGIIVAIIMVVPTAVIYNYV